MITKLKGFSINGRFKIGNPIAVGGFGKIYDGQDKEFKIDGIRKPVIIKFSKNHAMNDRELNALSDVISYAKISNFGTNEFFAETYAKGKVVI